MLKIQNSSKYESKESRLRTRLAIQNYFLSFSDVNLIHEWEPQTPAPPLMLEAIGFGLWVL